MSNANDRSIGEELVRIIRAEIRAYDERKDEAVRLRRAADEAVANADQAHANMRDAKPNSIGEMFSAAFSGDTNAEAIDALFERQQKSHVDFATTVSTASVDELLRQQQSAEKTAPWRPPGAPPATRAWWPRKKR